MNCENQTNNKILNNDNNDYDLSPSCLLRLRDALECHSLNLSDVEPEVLKRFCAFSSNLIANNDNQEYENGIQRVVRLTLTNKELEKHGLEPLLFESYVSSMQDVVDKSKHTSEENENTNKALNNEEEKKRLKKENDAFILSEIDKKVEQFTEDDIKTLEEVGLSPREYVTIKGEYGMVLGLHLEKGAYDKILKTCRSKSALQLRVDKNACKDYLCEKIIDLARSRLRRPSIIPCFKIKPPLKEINIKRLERAALQKKKITCHINNDGK